MRNMHLAGVLVAVVAGVFAATATAHATPSRTTSCTGCHSGVNVPVTTSLVSANATNATYSFSSPNADSVAVFDGSAKLTTINAASGQFTVAVGKTYTVYAVAGPGTNDGIGSTTVSPAAPVVDATAPTTSSNAQATYVGSAAIQLTATDNVGGTGVASTYYRLNGGPQTVGTTVNVATIGSHSLEFWSVDVQGNIEAHHAVGFSITAPPEPKTTTFVSVAGSNRYETAVQASQQAFPAGAPCVVIATGANWPDALGGGALAAAKGGPILLTSADTLPASVLAEIERLNATEVFILGGTGAVGPGVEAALVALLGDANVVRIGGSNRYQTAEMIAQATVDELNANGGFDGTAFVGTGANFPDALAAAPLSAAKGWPLFLAGPNGLSASTVAAMQSCGVTDVLVLGGSGVVSSATETALVAKYGDANVTRLAGANRFDTAVVVASYGCDVAGLSWDGLAIATGENFPDALAGGVMQGRAGSVMLLTRAAALHVDTETCLDAQKADITTVTYLGGTGALSTTVRAEVAGVLN